MDEHAIDDKTPDDIFPPDRDWPQRSETAPEMYAESTMTMEAPMHLHAGVGAMRAYWLRQVSGPAAPREIPLQREELIIGRSRSADIQVDSPELSRQHVKLIHENKEICVHDLNSRNGVFVNGVKIHACALRGGDTLQIGNVAFVFYEGF